VFDQLGGLLGYGTIPKFNSFGNTEWLMHINNCIKTLIKDYFVGMVILEDVYYIKNIKTYKELCFLSGTVQATCYEHVGNNIFVLPTTFVRSKLGVKSKNEVFELIVDKFNLKGFVFDTHNDICDSIALGLSFMDRKALFKTASMLKIEKALGIPLEDYIVREYWTNEKTIDSIAKDIKVGYSTLHGWFSNLKIPIKTRFFNYDKFPSSLTYDQEQVLLGTVLGDGGLYKSNTSGGSYHLQITHSLDQRAYLEHKAEFFAV
jgi:Holliday junction resolvasome RuvABC endonuclease subunit